MTYIESGHINAGNRLKNLIFLYICQYLAEKVGESCRELSAILTISPIGNNHGGARSWLLTRYNSTDVQITALDQPLPGWQMYFKKLCFITNISKWFCVVIKTRFKFSLARSYHNII